MRNRSLSFVLLIFALVSITPISGQGQTLFTLVNTPDIPGVMYGDARWGDFENDGDLDILLGGRRDGYPTTQLWTNQGNDIFWQYDVAYLPQMNKGFVDWGDYNNDDFLDIVMTGSAYPSGGTEIWENRFGGFNRTVDYSRVTDSGIKWGHGDNDGKLDLLMESAGGLGTTIWNNNGFYFDPGYSTVVNSEGESADWGDYDNDGDLDVVLVADGSIQIWMSHNGHFFEQSVNFYGGLVRDGDVKWGDLNNDGKLDFIWAGPNRDNIFMQIGLNIDGSFAVMPIYGHEWRPYDNEVELGDYDNDGDLDLILIGKTYAGDITQIWVNDGNGQFALLPDTPMPGVSFGSVDWGDYDNDGDLDILLTGSTSTGNVTQIWKNNAYIPNTQPETPTGLNATYDPTNFAVTFSWDAAADAQTPSQSLTYNLRVGTYPGGNNVVSSMAGVETGKRRIAAYGNMQYTTQTQLNVGMMPPQTALYWSVQAIDTAFAGSNFAVEGMVTVGYEEPTLEPPTATHTDVPVTATFTPVPPTATNTAIPPTATHTVIPATATSTTVPATATNTSVPTATNTPTVRKTLIFPTLDKTIVFVTPTSIYQVKDETSVELLQNGGFEISTMRQPEIWKGKGLHKDRLDCDIETNSGLCAFRFVGSPDENARLVQTIMNNGQIVGGMTLNARVYYRTNDVKPKLKVKLIVSYIDETLTGRVKRTIKTLSLNSYTLFELAPYTIDSASTVTKVKFQFQNKALSGKIYLDDASVSYTP